MDLTILYQSYPLILGKFSFICQQKRYFVSEFHALPWLVPCVKQPVQCLLLKTPGRDSIEHYGFMFVSSLFCEDPSLHTENAQESNFEKKKAEDDRNSSLLQSSEFISDSNTHSMVFYFCYFSSVTRTLMPFATHKMSVSASLIVH